MITIISGTNRPNNQSIKLAKLCKKLFTELNKEAQILDLQSLPEDFLYTASYGKTNSDFEKIIETHIIPSQKFVFIIPEYNGSFPGVLKSFVDCINPEFWHNKRATLIGLSAGRAGNLRGLDHFTGVLHYLQVEVFSKKQKLSQFHTLLNNAQEVGDEIALESVKSQLKRFLEF